jgi:hypothetical protein
MIGGKPVCRAFAGICVMPGKTSPGTAIVISARVCRSPHQSRHQARQGDLLPRSGTGCRSSSAPRTHTADEPAAPASVPAPAASTKAKSAPVARTPGKQRIASPDGTTMTTVMMRADAQRRLDQLRSAISRLYRGGRKTAGAPREPTSPPKLHLPIIKNI